MQFGVSKSKKMHEYMDDNHCNKTKKKIELISSIIF